ncbi:MAG TPA: hypothetical protein VLX92_04150 [Kofleriaceae bacterium]|nr:hypothetical protein [Kofleriaceae bacterium]
MNKRICAIVFAAAALVACNKKKDENPAPPPPAAGTGSGSAMAGSGSAMAGSAEAAGSDVPTEEDFEDQAKTKITDKNVDSQLSDLEKQLAQ